MRRVFRLPFSKARLDRDVDDELAFHLETRVARLVAGGMAPNEARAEALRQFGDVAAVRESMVALDTERERSAHRAELLSELRQDARYAARALRRNAGITVVIVGILAIGIGANTAIFTLIDAVLVRALPVDRPQELVVVGNATMMNSTGRGTHTVVVSAPLYRDIRDGNDVFSDVLATGPAGRVDVRIDGGTGEFEHPQARYVSGNYFAVLGVRAIYGRTFDASLDAVPGSSPVVTISHAYWTRRFQADPHTIGKTMIVGGVKMTIVGVTPPSFTGEVVEESADVWLPLSMYDALAPNAKRLDDRTFGWLLMLGRLRPGATLAQARQRIPRLMETHILRNAPPRTAASFRARTQRYFVESGGRGLSEVRDTFEAPLVTLMIGVGLLLVIICANVANLLLARAIARGREMAVRLALGANRSRLVRQLLTESALLALLAASVGLVVAWWGSRGLLALAADGGSLPVSLHLDIPVLAFSLAVSVLSVALFGLVPALRASRVDLASAMRANAQAVVSGGIGRRRPVGASLIAGQVALSVVLLVGAGMLVRSLRNVQSVETGMDRDHLVIADVDIVAPGYAGARLSNLTHTVRDRLAAIPGVAAVTFSQNGIFSGTEWSTGVQVAGFTPRDPRDSVVATDIVGAEYAEAVGARVIAGRDMRAADEGRLPPVALVNESLAAFYFPGRNAIGQILRFNDTIAVEIVGVIGDIRDHSLTDTPRRRVYFNEGPSTVGFPSSMRFVVRTSGDPAALVQQIRGAIRSVDAELPIESITPLATLMRRTISERRLVARVATGFGTVALLLAAVGLYGVMTYAITRRTNEIGLRVALGASPNDVVAMVLRDALRLVAIGVVVGLPLAVASARLLRAQLHQVSPADPMSIAVATIVLALSAVAAASLPALRAARVSPLVALRSD